MPTILLTKPAGRLSDSTLIQILRMPESWTSLPAAARERIYALLPRLTDPHTGQPIVVSDTSISPLKHELYGEAVKNFLAFIEERVADGADKRAWMDEALRATRARAAGRYDETKEREREAYWGQKAWPGKD